MTSIGIDLHDNQYYAARVEYKSGRPEIKALMRFDLDRFKGHELLDGEKIITSVDDAQVITKRFQIDQSEANWKEQIIFELSQALNEEEDNFCFDIVPTGFNKLTLGLALPKPNLDIIDSAALLENNIIPENCLGRVRTLALAKGYLTFCQKKSNELICLLDASGDSIAYVFLYQCKIIDIGSINLKIDAQAKVEEIQAQLIELKILINFKLSGYFKEGITVPLSKILISGKLAEKQLRQPLLDQFHLEISEPEINHGFLSDDNKSDMIPLNQYLIALGLTVE